MCGMYVCMGRGEVIYIVGEVANSVMMFAYMLVLLSTREWVFPWIAIWGGVVYVSVLMLLCWNWVGSWCNSYYRQQW